MLALSLYILAPTAGYTTQLPVDDFDILQCLRDCEQERDDAYEDLDRREEEARDARADCINNVWKELRSNLRHCDRFMPNDPTCRETAHQGADEGFNSCNNTFSQAMAAINQGRESALNSYLACIAACVRRHRIEGGFTADPVIPGLSDLPGTNNSFTQNSAQTVQ